jgi:hypothetical protein
MEMLNKENQYYYGLIVFYKMITREMPLIPREDYYEFTYQVINYYLFYWQALNIGGEDRRQGGLRVIGYDLPTFEELEKRAGFRPSTGSKYHDLARLIPINIITTLGGSGSSLSGKQAYSFVAKQVNKEGLEIPKSLWVYNPGWYGYKAMRLYYNVTEFGIPEYPYDGAEYRKIKTNGKKMSRRVSRGNVKSVSKRKSTKDNRRTSPRRSVRRSARRSTKRTTRRSDKRTTKRSARRSDKRTTKRSAKRTTKRSTKLSTNSKRKKCRSNQIRNPATGRCVLKRIFNKRRKTPKKSVSRRSPLRKNTRKIYFGINE